MHSTLASYKFQWYRLYNGKREIVDCHKIIKSRERILSS